MIIACTGASPPLSPTENNLPKPAWLRCVRWEGTSLDLRWGRVENAPSYRLYSEPNYVQNQIIYEGPSDTYSVTGLEYGHLYQFGVSCVFDEGESPIVVYSTSTMPAP